MQQKYFFTQIYKGALNVKNDKQGIYFDFVDGSTDRQTSDAHSCSRYALAAPNPPFIPSTVHVPVSLA